MKEIICSHSWQPGGFESVAATPWKICKRCEEVWYEGAPEPEVVIARIKE